MHVIRLKCFLIFAIPVLFWFAQTSALAATGGVRLGEPKLPALIRRGPTSEKVVALTFDDGPDPRFTPRIINALKERHIHATFFIVGQNAENYPNLVRMIDEDGDVIGNHTYTHPDIRLETVDQVRLEISKCEKAIESITGRKPKLFRPPKGFYDRKALDLLTKLDYQPVLWALTVEHKACVTPQDLARRIIEMAKPGDIILAHDGRLDREKTVEAIPLIIDGLKSKGYRFVTVPEMLDLLHNTKTPVTRTAQETSLMYRLRHLHF